MKKIMPKLLAITMVVAILSTCLVGCSNKNNNSNTTAEKNPVENASFVNLDINPNIDLVVDEKGLVLSVVANNEDAEKLLLSVKNEKTVADGVKGQKVSVAVNTIVKASVEMEYINDSNKDVKVVAIKSNGSVDTELVEKTKTAIHQGIEEVKADAIAAGKLAADFAEDIITETTKSVNRRLENAKEQLSAVNAQLAEELTAGKLLLMETVEELSNGAVALEDSIKMSVEELNRFIYDLSQEVKVVAQGAVEKVQAKAIEIAAQAEKELKAVYEQLEPTVSNVKFLAAKGAKIAFVETQKNFVKFINRANEVSIKAIDAMKDAPANKTLQNALVNDVNEIANDLFTEDAKKEAFKNNAFDKELNRYTYRSVQVAVENELDKLDYDGLTDDAIVAQAKYNRISNKLSNFETKYAEEIASAKTAAKEVVAAAQKGMGKAMQGYVKLVAAFNKTIDAPAPKEAPEEFTSYGQLLAFTSDILTTQNANIEKAFSDWAYETVTPEMQSQLDAAQTKMAEAKANAKEWYENTVVPKLPQA